MGGLTQEDIRSEIADLAQMKPLEYELCREAKAKEYCMRVTILDAEVAQLQSENDSSSSDENPQQNGIVEQLVEMVEAMGELFHDKSGDGYITINADGHRKTYALDSVTFKEFVAHRFFKATRKAIKAQQLSDAMMTLTGFAKHDGECREVHIRVAQDGDGYLLDMCDDSWQALRVSSTGIEATSQPSQRFIRPNGALPLFQPDKAGDLEDLLLLINIDRKQAPIVVAVICDLLRPETAYPVTEITGEHGSGKSATQANIRALIDPKDVALRSPPRKEEDIFIAAKNNHIVSYNNASHLTPDYQDALCTLSTGGGYASRKLYSNGEEHSYDAKRPILINGIVPVATQADLMSRVVQVHCPKIKNRVSDADLDARLKKHGPRALGFILVTFSKALALLPAIEIEDAPRLMDFAGLGEAVARVMGENPGAFLTQYRQTLAAAATRSIEGAPVIQQLVDHMDNRDHLESTVGGLLQTLTESKTSVPRAWPKSARGFRELLDRYRDAMRQMDVTIEYPQERRNGQTIIVSKIINRVQTPSQSSQPSRNTQPREGGEGGEGVCRQELLNSGRVSV